MRRLFVLSATTFDTIKAAEKKIENWKKTGKLKSTPNLYRVEITYVLDDKLKFKKKK